MTPALLLHFGVGFQSVGLSDAAPILNFNAEQTWGLVGATLNRNTPFFGGLGCGFGCPATGGMYNMGPAAQSTVLLEKPTANASITWVKQSHTYKLGGELFLSGTPDAAYTATNGFYDVSVNETGLPYLAGQTLAGGSLGFPYASFLLGRVDNFLVSQPANFRFGKKQFAIFVQDSWKVTRRLTLDYGVRWDYGTYYKEQYGRAFNFTPALANPSAGGQPGAFVFEGSGPGHCNCEFASSYPYAFGPRVGAAYKITTKTVLRAGWGLLYNQTAAQGGIGSGAISSVQSVNSPGNGQPAMILAQGIPPQDTPIYPNFNPGIAPLLPTGNQAINLTFGSPWLDPGAGRPARQNQWSLGIQREINRDLAVEISYVRNRGVWWNAPGLVNLNAITPLILSHYGLDLNNPADLSLLTQTLTSTAVQQRGFKIPYTGFFTSNTLAQALRPFPQFSAISASGSPLGKTWYDSLQAKATQRLWRGLTFTSAFTWQKSLQIGEDSNTVLNNVLANPNNAKSYSSFDQPLTFVVSASYTTPKWGSHKRLSQVTRDWNIGTILQYASGLPIPTPTTGTTLNSQIFQQTLANRVGGQPLFMVDINCHCFDPSKIFVLNPKAWTNPANGQFGNSAEFYGDFRYQRHPNESIGIGRTARFKERLSLMVRVDFSNVFNRTYLNNPVAAGYTAPQSTSNGLTTGGFGYINRATTGIQIGQPRNGTLVARFAF